MPRRVGPLSHLLAHLPWAITFAVLVPLGERVLLHDEREWVREMAKLSIALFGLFSIWYFASLTPLSRWLSSIFLRHRFSYWWTERTYLTLVDQWVRYVRQGRSVKMWRIRAALAEEYVSQEKTDLSGEGDLAHRHYDKALIASLKPEGRPLIITSFVRYSRMVEAMVNAAREGRTNKRDTVLCITTLSMPLEKWFNFDERSHCIHREWERYLDFLRKEVQNPGEPKDIIIARILLVHRGQPHPTINLQSEEELRRELRSWIWLKNDDDDPDSISNRPAKLSHVKYPERMAILKALSQLPDVDQVLLESVRNRTTPKKTSYLILPETTFAANPPQLDQGEFRNMGRQFIRGFQTGKTNGNHAYYARVEPDIYLPNWEGPNNLPPIPLDMFYVGLVKKDDEQVNRDDLQSLIEHSESLFCLGAEPPDRGLHMAYLYLIDPQKNSLVNFPQIERYLRNLIVDCVPLNELMH